MPDDQIQFYIRLGLQRHQQTYRTMLSTYNRQEAQQATAEVAYYHLHCALPEWGRFIERVDNIDGNLVFIHRKPEMLQ